MARVGLSLKIVSFVFIQEKKVVTSKQQETSLRCRLKSDDYDLAKWTNLRGPVLSNPEKFSLKSWIKSRSRGITETKWILATLLSTN